MDALVGVLALQGAFRAHELALAEAGARTRQVRLPRDLEGVDALVMPGGESTTMSKLLETSGLFDELKGRLTDGLPVFGTCAGMILLAGDVLDGRPDQLSFGVIDICVRRNGYGRQIDSFEAELDIPGVEGTFTAVFIRAPIIEGLDGDIEVLASHAGQPVAVACGNVFGVTFHPELTDDVRLHGLFVERTLDTLSINRR